MHGAPGGDARRGIRVAKVMDTMMTQARRLWGAFPDILAKIIYCDD
jgi:hypothetical protein